MRIWWILLPALAALAGVVVTVTEHSLLGPILIVAGAGGLGVSVLPAALTQLARWLSMGR